MTGAVAMRANKTLGACRSVEAGRLRPQNHMPAQ